VHLALFPQLNPAVKDDLLSKRWEQIMKVRSEVSKALELARVKKVIGHSLDAAVAIKASGDTAQLLREFASGLAAIFIVSKVTLEEELNGDFYKSEGEESLEILVSAAPGVKCERCWCFDEEVGSSADHPTLCPKCQVAVK
jgi:isoleucyl-tRNA synthetase